MNTKTLDDQLAADAATQDVAPDALANITSTAHQLRGIQHKVRMTEKLLEDLQIEQRRLAEQVLPSMMDEAGVKYLQLDDGTELMREEAVYASLAKEKRAAACTWLCKNGYEGIVKNAFSILLPRGATKEAARVAAVLKKSKVKFEFSQMVHPQTLLAFVRESIEAGRKLPNTITFHIQPTAKLKVPSTGGTVTQIR